MMTTPFCLKHTLPLASLPPKVGERLSYCLQYFTLNAQDNVPWQTSPTQNADSAKMEKLCSMKSHLNSRLRATGTIFKSLALMWVPDAYDTRIKFDFSFLRASKVLQTQIILTQTCEISSRFGSLTWYFILSNATLPETWEPSPSLLFPPTYWVHYHE